MPGFQKKININNNYNKTMYQDIIKSAGKSMEESLEFLKNELSKIRTGRANTELVADISVESYGTKTPLKQLATISVPEPQVIVIQPYDKNTLGEIEKSIQASQLELNPVNDGNVIRINIPPLTEERRKEIVSIMKQKLEETRISIRTVREKGWKEIKDLESSGKITEDDKFKAQEELNKIIENNNEKIEEIGENKEKEILSI
jgi:ribosome recycling factor